MKILRVSFTITILVFCFSGCAAGSNSPLSSTKPFASIIKSHTPYDTFMNTKGITVSPTPSLEATDAGSFASPTPSGKPTGTSATATASTMKGIPGLFNEDTYSKYFHFGMSMDAVERELMVLKIKITYKTNTDFDYPHKWGIATDDIQFQFDNNKRLYAIDVANWETAKGYVPGGSSEILHHLYGKEDEVEYSSSLNYVYAKKDCYFSVEVGNAGVSDENRQFWSVFVDIWNDPHILDKGAKSSAFMAGKFTNDDAIQFNEDNFRAEYPIGMSRQALVEELDRKRVRITGEAEYIGDGDDESDEKYDGCIVETDHAIFEFDSKNSLVRIDVYGWPTERGLKPGDIVGKLYELYGKETNLIKDAGGEGDLYIYLMKGYLFDLQFGDNNQLSSDTLNYWSVFLGQ